MLWFIHQWCVLPLPTNNDAYSSNSSSSSSNNESTTTSGIDNYRDGVDCVRPLFLQWYCRLRFVYRITGFDHFEIMQWMFISIHNPLHTQYQQQVRFECCVTGWSDKYLLASKTSAYNILFGINYWLIIPYILKRIKIQSSFRKSTRQQEQQQQQ